MLFRTTQRSSLQTQPPPPPPPTSRMPSVICTYRICYTSILKTIKTFYNTKQCGYGSAQTWLELFSWWPAGKIQTFGHGVYPQSTSLHMHNPAGRSLHAFTTPTNPLHYSGERWSSRVQQAEAGSDMLTPLRRSRDLLDNTHTHETSLSV